MLAFITPESQPEELHSKPPVRKNSSWHQDSNMTLFSNFDRNCKGRCLIYSLQTISSQTYPSCPTRSPCEAQSCYSTHSVSEPATNLSPPLSLKHPAPSPQPLWSLVNHYSCPHFAVSNPPRSLISATD